MSYPATSSFRRYPYDNTLPPSAKSHTVQLNAAEAAGEKQVNSAADSEKTYLNPAHYPLPLFK
jgi:hypothetical protein